MEIKTAAAQAAISLHVTATLNTLPQNVADTPEKLFQHLTEAKLQQTGPMVFVYRNMSLDMKMDAKFEIEIAIPVANTDGYNGTATACTLGELLYVETIHKGDLRKLGDSYQSICGQLTTAGLTMADETREVYTHFVDSESADNITHIQVGVTG